MKINGKTLTKNSDILVLSRQGEDVVITAEAVLSYEEFDKICPQPEAPTLHRPGTTDVFVDYDDQMFKDRFDNWVERRRNWFMIQALAPTKIEWESVNPLDPDTWENWEKEMRAAFFSDRELILIVNLCKRVSSMDEIALEAARQRFINGTTSKVTQ